MSHPGNSRNINTTNNGSTNSKELYTESEEALFGSSNFTLDENHVSNMVGMCNVFCTERCPSCDRLAEEERKLEATTQNQLYNLSVAKTTNAALKNKLTELDARLREGSTALDILKAEVEIVRKQKLELEEKLKSQPGTSMQVQIQPVSTTTTEAAHLVHGLDIGRKHLGCFCLCNTQYSNWQGLYDHFQAVLVSREKNYSGVSVACCACKQKLFTWVGLLKHVRTQHETSFDDFLRTLTANVN